MSNITLVSHPIVQSKICELRDSQTSSHRFRALIKEITTVLGIEATRDLPLKDVQGVSGRLICIWGCPPSLASTPHMHFEETWMSLPSLSWLGSDSPVFFNCMR